MFLNRVLCTIRLSSPPKSLTFVMILDGVAYHLLLERKAEKV